MSNSAKITLQALTLLLLANTADCIDNNGNGLSDVWEQRYNARALQLLDDDDGDGFKNAEECIAGTDPFSSSDHPKLNPLVVKESTDEIELSYKTLTGKTYKLSHSSDLVHFDKVGVDWLGDGNDRSLKIHTGGLSEMISPIQLEFWADLPSATVDALYALDGYPSSPNGSINYFTPQAPTFQSTGYGARLTTQIRPPSSGNYTFYLSAGGPAELYINSTKIAEILPTQAGIASGEWQRYPTQSSNALALAADQLYSLDLRYVAAIAGQHVHIGWSGPGLAGIEPLDPEDIAKVTFHAETSSQTTLFQHDYDSTNQTGKLWANSTGLETDIPGMSGNAERITADLGTSIDELLTFSDDKHDHLYVTWLFNMSQGVQDTFLYFQNELNSDQQGPRVDIEDNSAGTLAVVRAGGSNGSDAQINIEFDKTFRVELIASLNGTFQYRTATQTHTVVEDTFDLYVSDPAGNLVGSATALTFRDAGSNVVQALTSLRLQNPNTPNIVFDDWQFTSGLITGKGYLTPNNIDYGDNDDSHFFKLEIEESDQDGDGIADWEEIALGAYYDLLFFDNETINGTADASTLAIILDESQGLPDVALYATDAAAFESNYPNTISDDGEITITRSGALTPLTIQMCVAPLEATGSTNTVCDGTCCMLIGSAGDEEAELEDYQLIDQDGSIVTNELTFAFGEMQKTLTVKAINDDINEYPETLNIAIAPSHDNSYTTSELLNGASIQLFDLPDNPDNVTIFTGTFSQDGKAVIPTNGSGFVTATLNGPRTQLRIWDEFSGLTSAQQDSHVHKSNDGAAGNIIYAITETPGDNETEPLNGPLVNYPWDLLTTSGAISSSGSGGASKQVIIDSLFGQNGESPLYLNVHTVDNPAGEIWAFFSVSGGSTTAPGEPPAAAIAGSAEYPLLSGDLLECEVRRFLNQATFGATDQAVAELVSSIETARSNAPNYHRYQAFSDWIDNQMNPALYNQTYLLELTLADHFQMATLAGIFDPVLNPTDGLTTTPIRPASWPTINRSDSNPEHWYLNTPYPFTSDALSLTADNGINLSDGNSERRHAHWQTMLNADDQLRQKMGFALQQIVVVSAAATTIRDNAYGSANYQDMLNTHAFSHYRDILGFVNWSPIMGRWLSSLQNQKAIDFDGDGLFDSYPDENLARENMQLFSIGLFQIWPDGTLKLSSEGLPQPTYTNDDIREFAKILTGQSFSQYANYSTTPTWGGVPFVADNDNFNVNTGTNGPLARSYLYPMKMFGDYHSLGTKTFAGTTIDNTALPNPTQQGIADIESAIDWLAGTPGDGKPDFDMVHSHISTPAFISRRLIQRFVTSNPSREYLHRVANTFKESEGDLGLTLKALLLDPEARTIDLNDTVFGMKKSPLESYLQLLRSLAAYTYQPLKYTDGTAPYDNAAGDYSNQDLYLESFQYPAEQLSNNERNVRFMPARTFTNGTQGLQMDPFLQPTVFNFYLPDFSPGGVVGDAGLVAPELQLANEPDIIRNINYFHDIIRYGPGPNADELGITNERQNVAFGFTELDDTADDHGKARLPFLQMANDFYPSTEPASGITTEADGYTESATGTSGASAPHWLRLSRTGDVFIASESIDGLNWSEISTLVLPMNSEVFIGLALTSHADGILATAEFSNISVSGGEGTWYNTDIGGVAATGIAVSTGADSFEIKASGSDIWGSSDECHFAYQRLDGDGEIIARVDSLQLTHDWAKAGVMIRETLAANSANLMTLISGTNGSRAQIRRVPRGRSSESFADEALLDALDRRLTNGLFKLRYPYDTSDNDDPTVHGLDDLLKNPREIIIDSVHGVYGDPYDGNNDEQNRIDKLETMLYLLTFSPEYQVKK
jgi:uncharacterized protein (DUF1800 family)